MGYVIAGKLQQIGQRALDLLFPPECISCHRELEELTHGALICRDCFARLPLVDWPVCRRCSARVPDLPHAASDCPHCRREKLHFDSVLTLGSYDGLLRELILKMKCDRSGQLAHLFGQLLLSLHGETLKALNVDLVVPIPMTAVRRFARGTNPQAILGEIIGRSLRVPFIGRRLQKRNSRVQLGLSRPGRFRNMRGGMQVRTGYDFNAPHVLLVDDVLTTGATCSEAARVIKRSGAERVSVVVVGRTPSD